jgi:hypothetical protein
LPCSPHFCSIFVLDATPVFFTFCACARWCSDVFFISSWCLHLCFLSWSLHLIQYWSRCLHHIVYCSVVCNTVCNCPGVGTVVYLLSVLLFVIVLLSRHFVSYCRDVCTLFNVVLMSAYLLSIMLASEISLCKSLRLHLSSSLFSQVFMFVLVLLYVPHLSLFFICTFVRPCPGVGT